MPIPKVTTTLPTNLDEARLISLVSHEAKTYRQVLARRLRVNLQATLRDTQALRCNEGCTRNGLVLTQVIGSRVDCGKATYVCFVDLKKAFDVVNRRLLWARLSSMGIYGDLLAALQRGYENRGLMGKLAGWMSTEQPDNGRGVRQGEVDSSDAFAAFVDGLDDEIMDMERRVGRFLGIPLLGGQCGQTRLNVLKHADDTVLVAETEEDLQVLVEALVRWCEKWQVIPNAVKCKCMVWSPGKPMRCTIRMRETVLENTASYIYLGYRLDNTCAWRKHVDRRVESGDKWDRVVCGLLGRRGGLPMAAVARIRTMAAETSQLYGAELYAEAHENVMESATHAQVKTARDVLGVRDTAEATGVLLELGWTSVRRKAMQARFMLWWRIARSSAAHAGYGSTRTSDG